MDQTIRELERRALSGDPDAQARLERAKNRSSDTGPYERYIGKHTIFMGVRQHWRGVLRDVRLWGGELHVEVEPCWEVSNMSEEQCSDLAKVSYRGEPTMIRMSVLCSVHLAPPAWGEAE